MRYLRFMSGMFFILVLANASFGNELSFRRVKEAGNTPALSILLINGIIYRDGLVDAIRAVAAETIENPNILAPLVLAQGVVLEIMRNLPQYEGIDIPGLLGVELNADEKNAIAEVSGAFMKENPDAVKKIQGSLLRTETPGITGGGLSYIPSSPEGKITGLTLVDKIGLDRIGGKPLVSQSNTAILGGVTPEGYLVVGSWDANAVAILDKEGRELACLAEAYRPVAVRVAPDGRIFVVCADNKRDIEHDHSKPPHYVVKTYSPASQGAELTGMFPVFKYDDRRQAVRKIAVCENGDVVLLLEHYVTLGPTTRGFPPNERKAMYVRIFDKEGRFLRDIALPEEMSSWDAGLAVTPASEIAVGCGNRVMIFSRDGRLLRKTEPYKGATSKINEIQEIAITSDGYIIYSGYNSSGEVANPRGLHLFSFSKGNVIEGLAVFGDAIITLERGGTSEQGDVFGLLKIALYKISRTKL